MSTLLKLILWPTLLFGLSACVGEQKPATKASCPNGFAFDEVSRACLAAGEAPVATLSSTSVTENSGNNTVSLNYSDGNGDKASSCDVTNEDPAKIELNSPRLFDLGEDSLTVLSRVNQAYSIISPTATLERNTAVSAVENIRRATSLSVALSNRDIFIQAGRAVAQAALDDGGAVAATTGQVLMSELDDYEAYFSRLANRCQCVSGVCETVLVPRQNQTGSSGFSYKITDPNDGPGPTRTVAVTINPETKRPIPVHHDVSINESVTSTPLLQTFPAISALTYSSPSYSVISTTTQGSLNSCFSPFGLPSTCSYTPLNGDMSDEYISAGNARGSTEAGVASTLSLQGLDYTAVFTGEAGDDVRIRYSEYQGLGHPPEGSVRVFSDADGPIIDIVVISNLTMASDVRQEINDLSNDSSSFVNAVLPGPDNVVTAVAETALSGGENAQDVFTYRVCEGLICSDYDGVYSIRVLEQDDAPVVDVDNSSTTPNPALEDSGFTFNLSYTDADSTNSATSCSVTADTPAELSVTTPCSCSLGVCSADLLGATDFFGETSISVEVTNDGLTSLDTEVDLDLAPVNDEPRFREFLSTTLYAFPDDNIDENDGVTLNLGTEIYESEDFFIDRGDWSISEQLEASQEVEMEIEIVYTDGSAQDVIPQTSEFVEIKYNGSTITDTDTDETDPVTATVPSGSGVLDFTLTPDAYKNTATTNDLRVYVRLVDDGGTDDGGDDSFEDSFVLAVNNVDFAPTVAQKYGSTIENVETNEGGHVYSHPFIVTEGGLSVEPGQQIQVDVSSDNLSLLPEENIEIYYDENDNDLPDAGAPEFRNSADAGFVNLESPAGDASADHALILRLRPKGGESGTSNVTITVDDGTSQDDVTFALVVHPVSAIHGGWADIKAISNKVYDRGQLDPNRVCDPSPQSCNGGGACQGTVAPNSTVSADEENAVYYDSANDRCYHATSSGINSWRELNTFCQVTSSDDNVNCSGASCLADDSPLTTGASVVPTEVGQFFFDYDDKVCYRSVGTADANDWEEYFPSEVTLGWNDFVLAGSGADSDALINGWNVYRRKFGEPFDYTKPLNDSVLSASTREFTDDTANKETLYYYIVRPLDNKRSLPTATDDVFSELRILTPPESMGLVHRWMANLEVCQMMGRTLNNPDPDLKIDPNKNFRCPYNGPGATDDGGDKFYDLNRDLFVDRVEVGCPFSRNSTAISTCGSNGCIGIGTPTFAVSADGLVYYDRSSGACFVSDTSDTPEWQEVEDLGLALGGLDLIEQGASALLPPLVNVTPGRAQALCQARADVPAVDGLSSSASFELPSRKEQVAYSAAPLGVSDSAFGDIERGLSLNSSSKCNSSFASGIESGYTNSAMPSTSFYYSLPGTSSSSIRSMTTGSVPVGASLSTQDCVSRYGLQDVYGNVAEWVTESMECTADFECRGTTANFTVDTGNYSESEYGFDGLMGPCRDIDADGDCDAPMTEWAIQDKNHGASFLSFALGLPLHNSYVFDFPNDLISSSALEIGPTSGITNTQLKNDAFILNTAAIQEVSNDLGNMATGGGYKNERESGRYTFELVPDEDILAVEATGGTLNSNELSGGNPATTITFEAQQAGADGNNISVGLISTSSTTNPLSVSVSGSSITVEVSDGDDSTAQEISDAIVADDQANNLVAVTINGTSTHTFSAQTGNFLTGGLDAVDASRDDIGFRCMVPLPAGSFSADPEHTYNY